MKRMTETMDSIAKAMESDNMNVPEELLEEKDNINPDHYKNSTSIECIEVMGIVFGDRAVMSFCICNAWKYIWRWKHKNGTEDLEKANWYIDKAREFEIYPYYSDILENMEKYVVDIVEGGNK